ncbi:MAG TPA: TolC family protein, partial [Gemmatimonadaceae bacterium]|nr:TolC family protein [Gemmatimonadaceae bacterium]
MLYRSLTLVSGVILLAAGCPAFGQRPAAANDTIRLSLEDAVTTGLRIADEIRLSEAQSDAADAQLDAARASLLPQVRLTSTYTHTLENARSSAVSSVFNQPNNYAAAANISQTLFQGGKLISTARAASSLARAADQDVREQRALFTVTVQRAYLNALLAERMAELQETNLQLASSRLVQVQQLQAAGRAAQYDVLRARVERANIEPLAIQARNDLELANLEVKRLLNLPVDRPLVLTSRIDPDGAEALVAAYLDSTASPDRPALRSAEFLARSRHLAVSAARADLFPTVSAFFQTGYQAFPPPGFGFPSQRGFLDASFCPPGTTGRACQNGGWFEDRSFGLQFSWPIFDGLRAKSALEFARAQTRIADLQLQQTREQINVEVARARAELRRANAVFAAR